jgi:hypothetical protein
MTQAAPRKAGPQLDREEGSVPKSRGDEIFIDTSATLSL